MTEPNQPPFQDPQTLREWLRQVLRGVELALGSDDRPYRAVSRLIREGDGSRRPVLLDATADLLAELYDDVSPWSLDAAGQLFSLAGAVFADSSREGAIALQIAQFVQKALSGNVHHDIILSAGSALLTLRRHETPAFWMKVANEIGERSLPLVFEGIGRSAWDSLLNWLPEMFSRMPRAEQSLIRLLPYFASIRTGDELIRLADRVTPLLSNDARGDLNAFFTRASISRPLPIVKEQPRVSAPPRTSRWQKGVNARPVGRPDPSKKIFVRLRDVSPVAGGYFGAQNRADRASLAQYAGQSAKELFAGLLPKRHR